MEEVLDEMMYCMGYAAIPVFLDTYSRFEMRTCVICRRFMFAIYSRDTWSRFIYKYSYACRNCDSEFRHTPTPNDVYIFFDRLSKSFPHIRNGIKLRSVK
jgi:hypothetical protein